MRQKREHTEPQSVVRARWETRGRESCRFAFRAAWKANIIALGRIANTCVTPKRCMTCRTSWGENKLTIAFFAQQKAKINALGRNVSTTLPRSVVRTVGIKMKEEMLQPHIKH